MSFQPTDSLTHFRTSIPEAVSLQLANNEFLINSYESLITRYEWGFGILIGVFAIAVSLIAIFEILPARRLINRYDRLYDELKSEFEKRVDDAIKETRNKAIDKAIQAIGEDAPSKMSSMYLIDQYSWGGFTNHQIVSLIEMIDAKIEVDDLSMYLARQEKHILIDKHFENFLSQGKSGSAASMAAIYFASTNAIEKLDLVASIVINGYNLGALLSSLRLHNEAYAAALLDHPKIVKYIHEHEKAKGDLNESFKIIDGEALLLEEGRIARFSQSFIELIRQSQLYKEFKA